MGKASREEIRNNQRRNSRSLPFLGGKEVLPFPLPPNKKRKEMDVGGDSEMWALSGPGYFAVYAEVDDLVWVIIFHAAQYLETQQLFFRVYGLSYFDGFRFLKRCKGVAANAETQVKHWIQ